MQLETCIILNYIILELVIYCDVFRGPDGPGILHRIGTFTFCTLLGVNSSRFGQFLILQLRCLILWSDERQ
jgi:hypothetical protein